VSASIVIGTAGNNVTLRLDIPTLIDTRALITGNSGAGKSRLLRRLAEVAFGKVQIIVIDPEGEFATLRERHDFLLAGRNGEVQSEPRAAALLAKRLMELHTSAVLDLYDLRLQQRREFVRLFLEALIDLPKDLYAPVLVLLDEAHLFCPEKDEAESAGAVIDLMTRGRKRGVCGVLATQRLSKLDKDAAAEAKNVFVGGITLDVDQKRAADTLGLSGRDERLALRDIPPGEFLAFGPALSQKGVTTFTAGETFTTHPKAGQRHKLEATPTPDAIRKIAAELKDLPQQAAEEIRTLQAAQAKVRELQRELKAARSAQPPQPRVVTPKRVEVSVLKDAQIRRLEQAADRMRDGAATFLRAVAQQTDRLSQRMQVVVGEAGLLRNQITKARASEVGAGAGPNAHLAAVGVGRPAMSSRPTPVVPPRPAGNGRATDSGQQAILNVVATLEHRGIEVSREAVARWLGIHPGGGRYLSNLAELRKTGQLDGFNVSIEATQMVSLSGDGFEGVMSAIDRAKDGGKGARKVLFATILEYPDGLTREELAGKLGIHPGGGRFLSNLAWLRTMGVITAKGPIKATPGVFV